MPDKFKIEKIIAREILDSRGNPTVEATVILDCGIRVKASVPSGASTGVNEAMELRDGDIRRYDGKGVLKACANVEKISQVLKGMDVLDQKGIDKKMIELDGTNNKNKLGANAILSVSLAVARAGSLVSGKELYEYINENYELRIKNYGIPIPMFNIFNGGAHAENGLDFQEFMIVPIGIKKFSEQLRAGAEIFHKLGEILKENHLSKSVGDEGGYAPNIDNVERVFDMIVLAMEKAGYKPGEEVALALDIGASQFYNPDSRFYIFGDDHHLAANQLISLYRHLAEKYPIISIEDGLSENSFEDWEEMVREFARFKPGANFDQMMIVGDDLFVTNPKRLKAGIERKASNAVILKPNQIGTLSEAIEFAKMAKEANFRIVTSHRSGETTDDFIADLAVAIGSEFVKFGSLSRGERLVKYNRLMEISED